MTGTERLVVLAETRQTDPGVLAQLRGQIEAMVTDLLGTPPDDVVLAPPGSVLKTSSGKLRRAASRERYEQGDLGKRPRAVWWQLTRLALASVLPQVRRISQSAADVLYAAYVWALCGAVLPVVWGIIALLPRRSWCQAVAAGDGAALPAAVRHTARRAGTWNTCHVMSPTWWLPTTPAILMVP